MTYPKVTEIQNPRCEWEPNQVALTESERKAHEIQQQRINQYRVARDAYMSQHPTVCPKR